MGERRQIMVTLLVLWALAFGWSAWAILGMESTGDGLARGFNRIFNFMVAQVLAAIFAVAVLIVGWPLRGPRWLKWLSRLPALAAFGVAALIAVAMFNARAARTDPNPLPPKPVTAPIAPLNGS